MRDLHSLTNLKPRDVPWRVALRNTVGVVVPLSGWLGLRIGLTRLYVICLGAFSVGSALCGLAWQAFGWPGVLGACLATVALALTSLLTLCA